MVVLRRFTFTAMIIILLSGCAYFVQADGWLKKYEPDATDAVRIHPLGPKIYNHSGKEMSATEWQSFFAVVSESYTALQQCLGFNESFSQKLKSSIKSITIVPSEKIKLPEENGEFVAFIIAEDYFNVFGSALRDLRLKIFVRSDFLSTEVIRHELAHAYIALKNYGAGTKLEHPHHNPVFCSCISRLYCSAS